MNHKNRKKFNIYLSIFAVVSIIATLFFSGLVVNASQPSGSFDFESDFNLGNNDNLFSLSGYEASSAYSDTHNNTMSGFFNVDTTVLNNLSIAKNGTNTNYDLQADFPSDLYNQNLNFPDIDSSYSERFCFMHLQNDGFEINFFYLPDGSFVNCISNGNIVVYSPTINGVPSYMDYTTTKGYNVYSFSNNTQVVDGTTYYLYTVSGNTSNFKRILTSSVPIYQDNNLSTLENQVDFNYSDWVSGTGGLSRSDIEANSLLKNGTKIYLTNNSFDVGSLLIYPVFTETQKNNPNNFKLRLTGSCTYGITYNSGAGNVLSIDGDTLAHLYGFRSNGNNSVTGTLGSSSGDYLEYSFSELLSGKKSISLDQLNAHYRVSGRDKGIQQLAAGLDGTFGGYNNWHAMSQSVGGQSIMGFQFIGTNDGLTMYDCVPYSAHYIIEAWVVGNGVQASSPCCVIDVDLVTGTVTPIVENYASDQDIMSALNADILPSGYANGISPVSPNNMQGAITNSANASSGGAGGNANSNNNIESGAIVINNNPTFNNKNDLSGDGNSGLIPFILGLIVGNQKASTSTIENASNTSGWLSIFTTCFSFVPIDIWNLLIAAFTAAIGIMIVSFILGIIIKFIT